MDKTSHTQQRAQQNNIYTRPRQKYPRLHLNLYFFCPCSALPWFASVFLSYPISLSVKVLYILQIYKNFLYM